VFRLHFAIRLSSDCRAPVDSGQQLALRPLTTWPGKQNRPSGACPCIWQTARLSEFNPRSRTGASRHYPPTFHVRFTFRRPGGISNPVIRLISPTRPAWRQS